MSDQLRPSSKGTSHNPLAPGPSSLPPESIPLGPITPRTSHLSSHLVSPSKTSLAESGSVSPSPIQPVSSGILAVGGPQDEKLSDWLRDEEPREVDDAEVIDDFVGHHGDDPSDQESSTASENEPVSQSRPHSGPHLTVDSPRAPSKAMLSSNELLEGRYLEKPEVPPFGLYEPSLVRADGLGPSVPENASLRSIRSYASSIADDDDERLYPDIPYGRTLFFFGTDHPVRRFAFSMWSHWHMKYVIDLFTLAQMVVLAVETSSGSIVGGQVVSKPLRHRWATWIYLILYIFFSIFALLQMIAFGALTVRIIDLSDIKNLIKSTARLVAGWLMIMPEVRKNQPVFTIEQRCFFRKSWNRVEFVSLVCFWVSFAVAISENHPPSPVLMILSGIGHLRILRLLDVLTATKIVLRTLKVSVPVLRDALLFLGYFWIVYAIAGLRSFNSSLSRQCVWSNPDNPSETFVTQNFCGGHRDRKTGAIMPAFDSYGFPADRAKGFICPVNSVCKSVGNPEGNTMSFDNIFNSLELVFIIMSQNTFSDIMYNVINAEYMVSSIFFISGVLVLNLWLVNLLVAIMATSFDAVKEKLPEYRSNMWAPSKLNHSEIFSKTARGRVYRFCLPIFLLIIVADVVFQAIWGGLWSPEAKLDVLFILEIVTTVTLAVDVIFRIAVYFPKWRQFFDSKTNVFDLFLAIVCVVIIPFHNHKTIYGFLGFFQLLRFYRIVAAFKIAREMWVMVLGNYKTIVFLTIFYFSTVFLASLIAAKIFQGMLPYATDGEVAEVSFFDLSNSFMGMYQISTTENWSDVMFYATSNIGDTFSQACIAAFFCLWLFFSSFILMNMFVAIMTDNIVSRVKNHRKLQVEWFVRKYVTNTPNQWKSDVGAGLHALARKILRLFKGSNSREGKVKSINEDLQRKIIAEFLASAENVEEERLGPAEDMLGVNAISKLFDTIWAPIHKIFKRYPTGYAQRKPVRNSFHENSNLDQYVSEVFTMRKRTETFIQQYGDSSPQFDRSLWIFGRNNKIRRFCQHLYPSAHGVRASGIEPSKWVWYPLSTFLVCAIIVMVVFSCINTPIYQLSHTVERGPSGRSWTWLVYMDIFFCAIFTLEFIIKIIADGFHYTPNAYTHSIWNLIDFVVLIAMLCTVGIELGHGPSRYSRGLMALRALRLISMNPQSDDVFKSVFFSGLQQLLVACFIALGIIFPMAVWGKNMFGGRLEACNDSEMTSFGECVGEYLASPYDWDVWAPRVVSNPYFDYDSFGHALFITFGVLSLEGWIDVLNSVMAITDPGLTPIPFYRRYNALFPILWNFVGTVIIMTLFIAIIVQNYSASQGTAFLTKEQLSWKYQLGKFKSVRPKLKLPSYRPGSIRFNVALRTRGARSLANAIQLWALTIMTVTMFIFHAPLELTVMSVYFQLVIITAFLFFFVEAVKLWADGWVAFRRAYWQWYALFMPFSLGLLMCFYESQNSSLTNMQSGFLVLVLTLWIPRIRRLRSLLKMATVNIWQIITLMQTWFVLYLTWAIALNQVFGLTRIGAQSSSVQNFRTVPKALILLARMSSGENWNEILDDYLVSAPYCVSHPGFFETDCGDKTMAHILFTSWNIISMFIFANLFISLIYDTFWPVFHRATSSVSPLDLDKFKTNWQRYDPTASGFIRHDQLIPSLFTCEGYFNFGIYSNDPTFSVSAILERSNARLSHANPYRVDWEAINRQLDFFPTEVYRRKREVYNLFCGHMSYLSSEQGVSFRRLLKVLPLYKDQDPSKVLTLKQYLKLRLVLHEVRSTIAAQTIQRCWRLRNRQPASTPSYFQGSLQYF